MLWSVAGRFGRQGIWEMSVSELKFWYRGHVAMSKQEMGET